MHATQRETAVSGAAVDAQVSTAVPAGAGESIAVGAGPQKHYYTVQQQPPAGSCHYRYEHGEPLEDLHCTPGAISPAITQANLKSTICRKAPTPPGYAPPRT
ncbi:hypothetical protein ABZZ74_46645 [Streptomyces sp. NPDC006476]|uniref:hypothetical protein n=1 Tax=Streptomyces sp. NPDC006476 TaxID=3157175 RepID=UPI0033BD709F